MMHPRFRFTGRRTGIQLRMPATCADITPSLEKMPYTAEFRGIHLSIERGYGSKMADNISRTASAEHRKKRGRHIGECIDR